MDVLGAVFVVVLLTQVMVDTKRIRCGYYDRAWSVKSRNTSFHNSVMSNDGVGGTRRVTSNDGVRGTRQPSNDGVGGTRQPDNKTILCDESNFCYTLWHSDRDSDKKIIIRQGCWIQPPEDHTCTIDWCQASEYPKSNHPYFCCCDGNMCNMNISDAFTGPPVASGTGETKSAQNSGKYGSNVTRYYTDRHYKENTIIIALASVSSVAIITIILYFLYRRWIVGRRYSMYGDHFPVMESSPPGPGFNITDVKLCDLLSKGRYSEVWRGLNGEQEVAVKVFSSHCRQYYYNEYAIYSLPFMKHTNLLACYGGDERVPQDGTPDYMIVLTYMPLGSLTSYLKEHVVSWEVMCKMCHGIARGLAHLHAEVGKGEKLKPAIAHRDLNTRNILVRSDLTCVIADLGFCLRTQGSKLLRNGVYERAEQSSLTDVGTLRYMAPEVLDGAVNLHDCEASLKQIDIYALGLVIWEIATRCTDLYHGHTMPEYSLPYQVETGAHPTFEKMQILVSRNKVRPLYPDVWKHSHQATRALKETIDDCWDQDAEARLTALCVEERVHEMTTLWGQDNKTLKGVAPTINPTSTTDDDESTTHPTTSDTVAPPTGEPDDTLLPPSGNITSSTPLLQSEAPRSSHWYRETSDSRSRCNERSMSSSSATDTTILQSPSTESATLPVQPKTSNITLARSNNIMRPHQGRNPTAERNTHKSSDEELRVSGNHLMSRHSPVPMVTSFNDNTLFHLSDNGETSALVPNEVLPAQPREVHPTQPRNPPIPYLQNHVQMKQENVPGNGQSGAHTGAKSKTLYQKMRKPWDLGLKLTQIALFGRVGEGTGTSSHGHQTHAVIPPDQSKLDHHTVLVNDDVEAVNGNVQTVPVNDNVESQAVLVNGSVVVRPSSLPVVGVKVGRHPMRHKPRTKTRAQSMNENVTQTRTQSINENIPQNSQPSHMTTEPKRIQESQNRHVVAQTQNLDHQTTTNLISETLITQPRSEEKKLNTDDRSDPDITKPLYLDSAGSGGADTGVKFLQTGDLQNKAGDLRINSGDLRINSGDLRIDSGDLSDLEPGEKIRSRVKTPITLKRDRFSLYDDRIMSSLSCDITDKHPVIPTLRKSAVSLHQFADIV